MDAKRPKPTPKAPRQDPPLLEMEKRTTTGLEVTQNLTSEQQAVEVLRCLNCKDAPCVEACPLHIDIKAFISHMVGGDVEGAFDKISEQNPFPGVCGRVCQHELFCESACLLGKKLKPVAIGALERFAADYHRTFAAANSGTCPQPTGPKVALVGSGPASLIAAFDLVRKNYRVKVFEALHSLGGVLAYGIPPFRLPREILLGEIERLRAMGVEFESDVIVGKTMTVDELFQKEGFEAIFVGTGAGLPWFMGIPGESLIGVYTANEFLTRINLMHAHDKKADTPVRIGQRTIVIGGGNSAMDTARWAKRLGSESIIMFRRGRAEMKARAEEIEHAEGEGVKFEFLAAPVRIFGDEKGYVKEVECIRMRLGEPDESGRPSPIPMEGSEFRIPVDTIVEAIGQGPNPTLQRATPQLITNRGKIKVDEFGKTSLDAVYAGGDVVRGGSTVILAMHDGRIAAEAIHQTLSAKETHPEAPAEVVETHRILARRHLTPDIVQLEIEAPRVVEHWKAGQFVIVRPREDSERIPLTLVGAHPERRSIVLVVQAIGKTTRVLAGLKEGEAVADLVGPLGEAATIKNVGHVLCVAGGVGVAELLPVARAFREAGNRVTALCGARNKDLILLDKELRAACDEVRWATDDGSNGFRGTVVDLMRDWYKGNGLHASHVIGPIPMMKAAANLTREWHVPTYASLNPIMIDGTGMCGGCRVNVGGKIRFACVEGPEFDAHQVDFDELTRRNQAYRDHERRALEEHLCRIGLEPALTR
jgi:glutamate synthase (NADPH/NADH) small chain